MKINIFIIDILIISILGKYLVRLKGFIAETYSHVKRRTHKKHKKSVFHYQLMIIKLKINKKHQLRPVGSKTSWSISQ